MYIDFSVSGCPNSNFCYWLQLRRELLWEAPACARVHPTWGYPGRNHLFTDLPEPTSYFDKTTEMPSNNYNYCGSYTYSAFLCQDQIGKLQVSPQSQLLNHSMKNKTEYTFLLIWNASILSTPRPLGNLNLCGVWNLGCMWSFGYGHFYLRRGKPKRMEIFFISLAWAGRYVFDSLWLRMAHGPLRLPKGLMSFQSQPVKDFGWGRSAPKLPSLHGGETKHGRHMERTSQDTCSLMFYLMKP